ncbi:MAG: NAD(P)/FAD-dependent oxidoreductase [Gammaproteobacteria bacterium]|nr:NAD(P)/FAD-dependent oxidoreductase [Gammaproteobacteria bacterium]
MLHRALELGLNAIVLETGHGPGGTWYWNRYPGARFDSESYSYGYSFSKELLAEWDWSEHFAAQPETLRYLNHVVERFRLRDHMRFDSQVEGAEFIDASNQWRVRLVGGEVFTTRFLITAIGMLSAATLPHYEGMDTFQGESFHTYYWPQRGLNLAGAKVGVVGTGATAVQLIPEVAKEAGHLTVFQRRPNWCAPLHNGPIDAETMRQIKNQYEEIFDRCAQTPGGFLHGPDYRDCDALSAAEKQHFWEELYRSSGFRKWLGNFVKVLIKADANAEYSDFIANKIRQRLNDPQTATKLIPTDHGFGTRRVPLETQYYEAFNRDTVELVDLNETPITRVTALGIQTTARDHPFDIIVYATGFDAITGSFDRIAFEGLNGKTLREKWQAGPRTLLGLQTAGFPNLLTLAGPQSASVGTNFPRGIEDAVDWTADLLSYMRAHELHRVEATEAAEDEWTELVRESYDGMLLSDVKSWFNGYNSNVPGHDGDRYLVYFGGAPEYRQRLAAIAANDYEGFRLSKH